ncbi:hypothetical protein ACFY8F_03290 [Streptomyces tanashiensis]
MSSTPSPREPTVADGPDGSALVRHAATYDLRIVRRDTYAKEL